MASAHRGELQLRAWREERGMFVPAALAGGITLVLIVVAVANGGHDSLGASAWNGVAVVTAVTLLLAGGAWLSVSSIARAERRLIERVVASPLVIWPQVSVVHVRVPPDQEQVAAHVRVVHRGPLDHTTRLTGPPRVGAVLSEAPSRPGRARLPGCAQPTFE